MAVIQLNEVQRALTQAIEDMNNEVLRLTGRTRAVFAIDIDEAVALQLRIPPGDSAIVNGVEVRSRKHDR